MDVNLLALTMETYGTHTYPLGSAMMFLQPLTLIPMTRLACVLDCQRYAAVAQAVVVVMSIQIMPAGQTLLAPFIQQSRFLPVLTST